MLFFQSSIYTQTLGPPQQMKEIAANAHSQLGWLKKIDAIFSFNKAEFFQSPPSNKNKKFFFNYISLVFQKNHHNVNFEI